MRKTIACYSATGNSLFIAKMVKDATIVDIAKSEAIPDDTEILGIVCPVYCFTLPYPVRKYIETELAGRDNSGLKYIFAILTDGGIPLWAPSHLSKALADAGCVLSYVETVRMPDCYLPLAHKAPTIQERDALVEKSMVKARRILQEIENEEFRIAGYPLLYRIFGRIGEKGFPPARNKKLSVDESRCTLCKVCIEACPMGNIELKDGKIVHGNRCTSCFACYHFCPVNAVRYPKAKGQYAKLEAGQGGRK